MATAESTTCPHCAAALVTEGLRPGTTIVCAGCGGAFTFGRAAGGPPASRKAVASLALGVASFVGMFLTGVPAMVLGIMALRDISRRPGQVGGRGLAVSGIILGGVLSFLCSPCAGLIAFSVAQQVRNFRRETTQPDDVRAIASRIATCNLPAGLTPLYGFEEPHNGSCGADFCDTVTGDRGIVMLLKAGPLVFAPDDWLRSQVEHSRIVDAFAIDVDETRKLAYRLASGPLAVQEQLGTHPVTGFRERKYLGILPREDGHVGIMVLTRDEPGGMTEEEVRAFFESLR